MTYPVYPSVNSTVLKTLLARLFQRKRSVHADSLGLCAKITPPIRYLGVENLADQGPLLLTANHYSRPGFSTTWIAAGISAALPVEVTWIMSDEWLFEGNPFAFILRPLMRFVLRSITLAYGFLPMPTMVQGFSTPQQRSSGVRGVIEYLRAIQRLCSASPRRAWMFQMESWGCLLPVPAGLSITSTGWVCPFCRSAYVKRTAVCKFILVRSIHYSKKQRCLLRWIWLYVRQ